VFAQLAQHMALPVTVLVVHGMQEISGSSPLSSTQVRDFFRTAEKAAEAAYSSKVQQ
jgi:hypothetical protein